MGNFAISHMRAREARTVPISFFDYPFPEFKRRNSSCPSMDSERHMPYGQKEGVTLILADPL